MIKGFDSYLISNHGQVYSFLYRRILKAPLTDKGYHSVQLYKNKKIKSMTVHRLVALHFVPNPLGHPWVNHKDGIKKNCHWSNLEWCTKAHNVIHAYETGLNLIKRTAEKKGSHVGIYWLKNKKRWRAAIQRGGKRHDLGSFSTEEKAIEVLLDFKKRNNYNLYEKF